jgi:hypothetical protein
MSDPGPPNTISAEYALANGVDSAVGNAISVLKEAAAIEHAEWFARESGEMRGVVTLEQLLFHAPFPEPAFVRLPWQWLPAFAGAADAYGAEIRARLMEENPTGEWRQADLVAVAGAYRYVVGDASAHRAGQRCAKCFAVGRGADSAPRDAPKLKRCSRCGGAYYCSAACQRADWPAHKSSCAAMKKIAAMDQMISAIAAGRVPAASA